MYSKANVFNKCSENFVKKKKKSVLKTNNSEKRVRQVYVITPFRRQSVFCYHLQTLYERSHSRSQPGRALNFFVVYITVDSTPFLV